MPPPTVSGMNTSPATCSTTCDHGVAIVGTGGNIQKGQLIGAFPIVAPGDFHRIAGITDLHEADAFDDPAVVHVQAGDDALGQHLEAFRQLAAFGEIQGALVDGTCR